MSIRKTMAIALAVLVGMSAFSEENQPFGEANGTILDTIAQINHINWVVNVIKSYNNVIVLEEEYEKISPGNLYLDRIPDEETLGRITKMLDKLFKVNRGLFRDDPMAGTVALNKAFMLPKTKENKPEVRRCLELAWTKNANVTHLDW